MTYEPLHHKYRPQTFAELVGQEAIAATLTSALQQQRIAPAYLFTGARGTGKTSSARILAKSLNCLESGVPTATPCGRCEVCRTIANGSALDVIEIDAASNTGVDNIRELIERAQFAPVQCRYKVYVIDECHMLSSAAFNALLKTLEEPPDRVVFVLATTDPQRVLPTIISRCQRFDYRRIPLEAMVQHLQTIASKEGIPITPEAVTLVAQLSQGGLRDAESLLDQLSLLSGEITAEKVWDLVGAVPERDLMSLLEAIASNNAEAVLDTARRLMDRGREPLIVLQNLAGFYRDLLVAKTAPHRPDLVALTPPTWQQLCKFAQSLELPLILAGQQHLRSCEAQVKNTTQPRLWLEVGLLGLLPAAIAQPALSPSTVIPTTARTTAPSQPSPPPTPAPTPPSGPSTRQASDTPLAAPVSKAPTSSTPHPSAHPQVPSPQPQPEPDPITPAPTAAPPIPPQVPTSPSTNLEEIWEKIIQHLQPPGTQALLRQQCHLLSFNGREARVGVNSQPLFKMVQGRMPNIEAAFRVVLDQEVRVSLEVAKATPSRETPGQANAPPAQVGPAARPPSSQQPATAHGSFPPPVQKAEPPAHPAPATPHANPPSIAAAPIPPPPRTAVAPEVKELPPPTGITWSEEESLRAARALADFFNGKVVDLEGGLEPEGGISYSEGTSGLTELPSEAGDWDDDVPF